jgi:hypothetical protein
MGFFQVGDLALEKQCLTILPTMIAPEESLLPWSGPSSDTIPIAQANGHGESLPAESLSEPLDGMPNADSNTNPMQSNLWKSILDGLFWAVVLCAILICFGLGVALMASLWNLALKYL